MRITEPPYTEWPALLQLNKEVGQLIHSVIGEGVVRDQRNDTLAAARAYSDEVVRKATALGISLPPLMRGDNVHSIVMAGHQPVVYHPGLLFKNSKLFEIAQDTGALPISIIIDTDEGDAGRLAWPLVRAGALTIKHGTLAEGGALYRDQKVRSHDAVRELFAEVVHDLSESGLSEVAARVERVSKLYQSLSGEKIAIANSIVRYAVAGQATLEVPLSTLCAKPSFQERIRRLRDDRERFVALYNETLHTYRREHGIKNLANPFPDMEVTNELVELPFWSLKDGDRKPALARRSAEESSPSSELLVPRGSMVTFLLRSACADLFIHGLGGGKYDRFVDSFARAYVGASLPAFVVASETQYLFPKEVGRLRAARDLKAKYKELVSHTASFLGTDLFSRADEVLLRPLVSRRAQLLESLKRVATPEERRPIALALNDLNREIKSCIDQSSLSPILAEGDVDEATMSRWEYREFPFFFFDG